MIPEIIGFVFAQLAGRSRESCAALLLAMLATSPAYSQTTPTLLTQGTVVTGLSRRTYIGTGMCAAKSVWTARLDGVSERRVSALCAFHRLLASDRQSDPKQRARHATCDLAFHLSFVRIYLQIRPRSGGSLSAPLPALAPFIPNAPNTIGRGKVSWGVSYQRFRFGALDGQNLHKLPAVFSHVPDTGPGGAPEPYEADVIKTNNNIDLNMDQAVLFGTVGITDRIDLSVAVPMVDVRMGASSDATIVRVSGPTFTAGTQVFQNPHSFLADPDDLTASFSSTGAASGFGDVTFRFEGHTPPA